MKKEFDVIRDEDGIIIYDESDDYSDDDLTDENGFILKSNEEIFTDEYMLDYAEKMDAKIAHEKKIQRWISVGVIVGCIMLVALFSVLAYWRYIC